MLHKNRSPLVTIITPVYNRASLIEETIQSILSQDYPNIEYIVLDDGSNDDTPKVLKKYKDRIILVSHANRGETRTVNKGLSTAKGEFIVIVNSDDPLLPHAITHAVEFMQKHPSVLVGYPDVKRIDDTSKVIDVGRVHEYDFLYMISYQHCIVGPGAFMRAKALSLVKGRDLSFTYVADFEFWLRLSMFGQFARIPKVLATFRVHRGSQSLRAKGDIMAEEHIRLINHIFKLKDLPPIAYVVRRQAYSAAYFHAASLFDSKKKKIYAYIISCIYHPFMFIKKLRPELAKNRILRKIYLNFK